MPSRVVRIVANGELSGEWLQIFIQERLKLNGKIENLYVKEFVPRSLGYAYIVFELNDDAEKIVEKLNGVMWNDRALDVALIGPDEKYNRYLPPQRNSATLKKTIRPSYTYRLPRGENVKMRMVSENNHLELRSKSIQQSGLKTLAAQNTDQFSNNLEHEFIIQRNILPFSVQSRQNRIEHNINNMVPTNKRKFSVQSRLKRPLFEYSFPLQSHEKYKIENSGVGINEN